jgi:uncharacterized membrane protein YeaQ/YmgE (transglycosylase-associated protein family)
MRLDTKTKVLAVIGTIILGAVGNAVWELVKPGLGWLSTTALNVVTLGIESLRDDLYVEIARGFREKVAESVLGLVLGLLSTAILERNSLGQQTGRS